MKLPIRFVKSRWFLCPECGVAHQDRHGYHWHPDTGWGDRGRKLVVYGVAVPDWKRKRRRA